MKSTKLTFIISFVFLFTFTPKLVFSQTAGSLSFSSNTSAPTGDWGNKHTLAIWIENTESPSDFIKTRAKYGNDDDHLTSWVAKSGKNKVDAVTGPTLTSYTTRSVIWDGTDVSGVVVPDGEYQVLIEMGWGKNKTDDHSVFAFSFTKGPDAVQLSPAGNSNYSDVSINWEPSSTLVDQIKDQNNISVFPNPTSGMLSLNIRKSHSSSRLIIENSAGSILSEQHIIKGFHGDIEIDLSNFENGLYFIVIDSPDKQLVHKVILKK